MDEQLNRAPCGFLSLTEDGRIVTINETLLEMLHYPPEQLQGKHIQSILTVPAQMFYQLYFVPLIKMKQKVEEMYISLKTNSGEEIPVMVNALLRKRGGERYSDCVLFPIHNRSEYENELLIAKKEAEAALLAKHKANKELENTLEELKEQQKKLMDLNEQNQKFKIETKKELELARKIQKTSLTDPIETKHIQIQSFHKASRELSGDIYGFYQIDQHRYGIILLDVMGHGISSALITMSLHSLFQRLISYGVNTDIVMKELDQHLHTLFQNNEEARHYCTAIYLLIDTKKQKIEYINAGHPPAFWLDKNGEQHELFSKSVPIGMFEGIEYKTNTVNYSKGDRLLLYTDGVTDLIGPNQLSKLFMKNRESSLSSLKERIIASLEQQKSEKQRSDDQCLILIELK
ncbi:SpoIIE family protein phosphatase [Mesobacillus maritimus]|uniref:SpoIIE family protein phosphatase n=1 Tax=Mesobacillus maritimus TaxID=1643336 RepID=A0ABS7K7G5_9BACI|nr:SpoIIE family protein phosphatase [Mesobacillus maritimus]MBY0098055.1 SpoIIE family protein phosphatase [Mesobacillus maritimus]